VVGAINIPALGELLHAAKGEGCSWNGRRARVSSVAALSDALLLCTDGLTKHVSDERITERMRTMTSAEQVVRALVDDALAGGGTDNVTVLVVAGVRRRSG
jgi:serine/threonine protein phosphatase PrpC